MTATGEFSYLRTNRTRQPGDEGPICTPYVGYGGSGFAGKSYNIRTAALELNATLAAEGFPGQWGCIMTDTFPNLADRQISKIKAELSDYGVISRNDVHGLHFKFDHPALGGFLLRNIAERRGGEYCWLQIDELTEFERSDWDSAMYRLRSPLPLPFLSFGWASNPDGVGHEWVKGLWIEPDWTKPENAEFNPKDFVMIYAKPWDNPAFGPAVAQRLQSNQDPMLVKSRWEGSWDLNLGGRFSYYNRQIHTFSWDDFLRVYGEEYTVEELLRDENLFTIYGSLDYGTGERSASSFHLHAVDWRKRVWTFLEKYMVMMTLDRQVETLQGILSEWPVKRIYCDPALKGKGDDRKSRLSKFSARGVDMVAGNNDRVEGWSTFDEYLYYQVGSMGELLVSPMWRQHSSCTNLIRQIIRAPRSETRLEDVDAKFGDDHAIDDCRYFLHSHFRAARRSSPEPPYGSIEWWERRRQEKRLAERRNAWPV